jgi:hypothetical protein
MYHSSTTRNSNGVPQRRVWLDVVEEAAFFEIFDDPAGGAGSVEPGQPVIAGQVVAVFGQRPNDGQAELPAEFEVFGAGARRDVDDAGALLLADIAPGDDTVLVRLLAVGAERGLDRGQLIKRTAVAPTHEIGARPLFNDLEPVAQRRLERALTQPVVRFALANPDVRERGFDRCRHVRRNRPRRCGPDEQVFARPIHERQPEGEPRILSILVTLVHLHLRQPGSAAGAPGHRVVTFVQPPAPVDLGQEAPDQIVVLV